MNADRRCAELFVALWDAGLQCLVMGGHAVRFYGIQRNTVDYDLVLAPATWDDLLARLKSMPLLGDTVREGPSWRPGSFRRFVIGTLSDGREERLECWRRNHLLAPFEELHHRREEGEYGGQRVAFLGLDDLIRSKQTEREEDWRDLALLEEVADEVRLAKTGEADRVQALAHLRSRKGFQTAVEREGYTDPDAAALALRLARHPVTVAYLCPFVPEPRQFEIEGDRAGTMTEILTTRFAKVTAGSSRHLALAEAVRRLYKRACMEADRYDKQQAAGAS